MLSSGVGSEELSECGEESVAQLVIEWLQRALQEQKFQVFTEDVSISADRYMCVTIPIVVQWSLLFYSPWCGNYYIINSVCCI